jgi:ABC-type Fe3+/spermidine/putrescine transport system ATPase subunit
VTDPEVLLLDEPLSALDRKIRGEMQRELKRIHRETGLTTIMVTHDQEEAMNLGDTVLMLSRGAVQQFDEPESLYREPANGFVADFLGAVPLGRGVIQQAAGAASISIDGIGFPLGTSKIANGSAASAVIMAERVSLVAASSRAQAADEYPARVSSLEFYGPFARAEASLASLTVPSMMLSQHALGLAPGDEVWMKIADGGVHAFAEESASR